MKLASIFILTTPMVVLIGTAIGVVTQAGQAGVANPGAHGFSEILYAFTSAGNNNGSAFGGLSANTPFYNLALGIAMWLGRFWPIVAALAIGGSLASKKRIPVTEGTMPTHGPLFIALLIGNRHDDVAFVFELRCDRQWIVTGLLTKQKVQMLVVGLLTDMHSNR